MSQQQALLLFLFSIAFGGIIILAAVANNYSLNRIKSRKVGDGQHGTARFATKREIWNTYKHVPFHPKEWRHNKQLPTEIKLETPRKSLSKHKKNQRRIL